MRPESCPTIWKERLARATGLSLVNTRLKTMSSGKLISTDWSPNSIQSLSAEAVKASAIHKAATTTSIAKIEAIRQDIFPLRVIWH